MASNANEMKIVYVDPGYGKLVAYPTSSVYTGRLTWVKNETFNPTSGVAFTHDSDVNYASTRPTYALLPDDVFDFSLPTAVEGKITKKVLSLKCTIYYIPDSILELGFPVNLQITGSPWVTFSSTGCTLCAYSGNPNVIKSYSATSYPKYTVEGLHDVSMTYSMECDARTGSLSITRKRSIKLSGFNNAEGCVELTDSRDGSTSVNSPSMCVLYRSIGKPHSYVSNVLVGQAYYEGNGDDMPLYEGIPLDTRIYRLTTGATDTTFANRTIETEVASVFGGETTKERNTEYFTSSVGSRLRQQITSSGNTPANHVVVYGNPGYTEGGIITKATGIDNTTHNARTLSTEQDAHICDWWKYEKAETLNDLYGKYVGWMAGG